MALEENTNYWTNLVEQAKAGQLKLDPEAARIYTAEAAILRTGLLEVIGEVEQAADIEGLGDFECARQLQAYLHEALAGEQNSYVSALHKFIAVLDQMVEAVSYSVATITQINAQSAATIASIDTSSYKPTSYE